MVARREIPAYPASVLSLLWCAGMRPVFLSASVARTGIRALAERVRVA